MSSPETARRIKTYSAATGFVYQYQFHEVRPSRRGLILGAEYVYLVWANRQTGFPLKVFVKRDTLKHCGERTGRELTGTEEYALAQMARPVEPRDAMSLPSLENEPQMPWRRLVGVQGDAMQELAIAPSIRQAVPAVSLEQEAVALEREFETRLADSSGLAFRVARGVLRNSADAEEVAQEAFLKAYRSFRELRDREKFRGWLVRITFRLALDRARSAKRREAREIAWSAEDRRPTVEDVAAASEFAAHLDSALAELPAKFRIVLILTAIEGHTLEDVARLLDLPVGTVKSRMHFGKKQLAEKLKWLVNDTAKNS